MIRDLLARVVFIMVGRCVSWFAEEWLFFKACMFGGFRDFRVCCVFWVFLHVSLRCLGGYGFTFGGCAYLHLVLLLGLLGCGFVITGVWCL